MLEQEFNRARTHGRLPKEIKIDSYIASIRDRMAINDIFALKAPAVVFHAAAHKHVPLMETQPDGGHQKQCLRDKQRDPVLYPQPGAALYHDQYR